MAENKEKKEPTMDDLVAALQYIHGTVQKMDERMRAIEGGGESKEKKEAEENVNPQNGPDFESMSRGEMIDYLITSVNKAEKGINDRIDKLETRSTQADLRDQIESAREEYEDFDEWTQDIKQVMEKRPGLSIDEAYALAKHQNPDKVQELATQKEEEEREEREKQPPKFGGLMPTSGLVTKSEGMDPNAAAEAAWGETMGHRSDIQ